MSLRASFVLLVACLGLAGCGGSASGDSIATARTKAPDGAKLFDAKCADCHGSSGKGSFGTPGTMGSGTLSKFATAKDLFDYVHVQMPLPKASAGSLKEGEYWAIVSFMVAAHGKALPAGGLNAENAASVALH
jgi:mono/diheme cytochrome c family protein